MFLGINYDKWHGILAVLGIFAIFFLYWNFTAPVLATLLPPDLNILFGWFLSAYIAFTAQCAYEIEQLFNDNVEDIYGSYLLFVQNSKQDFKYFWLGVATSWILPLVYSTLYPL